MPLMLSKLYDALLEAGASESKARDAAEEAAMYEQRFAALDARMERVDGRVSLVQWMLGFNLALSVAILWKVFS
jgi:hypothetical protein